MIRTNRTSTALRLRRPERRFQHQPDPEEGPARRNLQPRRQTHVGCRSTSPSTRAKYGPRRTRLLEAIREPGLNAKFYQASSSELYGKVVETPQTETDAVPPAQPLRGAKAYAFYITQNYREAYGMFA